MLSIAFQQFIFKEHPPKTGFFRIDYLRGQETIEGQNSLFKYILEKWNQDDIEETISLFWSHRDAELDCDQKARIFDFWRYCFNRIRGKEEEHKDILSDLNLLAVFFDQLTAEHADWLKQSVKYVEERYHSSFLLEYLDKLADINPKDVGNVFLIMLEKTIPWYKQENIQSIVEKIYKAGFKNEIANPICDRYARAGFDFLQEFLNSITVNSIGIMHCIYCRNIIDGNNLSTEHVFPQSFGCPDDWTINCVCRNCNNELGGTIERRLAGDSMEGLWRLQKIGSRSKKPIKHERIKMQIPDETRYGEFRGIILFADFSQMDSLYMPAQIVVTKDYGIREHCLIEDMDDDDIKNIPGRFGLFAHNEIEYNQAVDRFKRLGKKFDEEIQKLPQTAIGTDGKLEVEIEGILDVVIFRTVAKIGFNYLAKMKGYEYALDKRFDVIREYIRAGVKPQINPVRIEKGHVLAEETSNRYFLEGHIFTIETRGSRIISKICLTNLFNFYYVVNLGDIGPIWHDIKSGHAYSLKEDKIIPLFAPTYLTIASRLKKIFGLSLRN